MTTTETTTSPARRGTGTSTPPLRHRIHHLEPNGTVHTFCGMRLTAQPGTIGTHRGKFACPACDAAAILWEVTL